MKEFEYLTMAIEATGWRGGKIDLGVLNNRLNELGREGWELVAMEDTNVTQGATRDVILILKRERIASSR